MVRSIGCKTCCYVKWFNRYRIDKNWCSFWFGYAEVCTGYEIDGKVYDYIPSDQADVAKANPVYKEFKGWKEDISKMSSVDELPKECLDYIKFIEEFTNVRVSMIL